MIDAGQSPYRNRSHIQKIIVRRYASFIPLKRASRLASILSGEKAWMVITKDLVVMRPSANGINNPVK